MTHSNTDTQPGASAVSWSLMALEGAVGQDLKENEKNVIGNWTKEDSRYVKSKGLAGLSPVGMWKAENVLHVLGRSSRGDFQAKFLRFHLVFLACSSEKR